MSITSNAGQLPPPKLPALRLTTDGECVLEDAVPLDTPINNTGFTVSYAPTGRAVPWVASQQDWSGQQQEQHQKVILQEEEENQVPLLTAGSGTMRGRPPSSLSDSNNFGKREGFGRLGTLDTGFSDTNGGLLSSRSEVPPPVIGKDPTFHPPPFSRAASMPLPSQLNQLQHPYRTTGRSSPGVDVECASDVFDSPHVRELSHELADSIQMVVQTLLQISPAQVLDPAKEQFTACSLSVPTSSMSAMFTVMKNINYISANMSSYFGEAASTMSSRRAGKQPTRESSLPTTPLPPLDRNEFDVGETIQAVGDSLSGCAAQAGVDLVLYHGDVSLKHVNVYGDEASLRYAITQVIQQVLNTAERGDSVELGLLLTPISTGGISQPPEDPELHEPPNSNEDPRSCVVDVPLRCTIRISHKFAVPERGEGDPYGPEPEQTRLSPNLSTISIRQILRHTSSTLRSDLPPPPNFPTGRTIELEFPLRRARSSFLSPLAQISEQHDATLPHLIAFAETLKGKRVTLYASAKGCFAQHLTSYLTAWGMVVSHVTPEGAVDGVTDLPGPPIEPPVYGGALTGSAALLALAGKLDSTKVNGIVPEVETRKPLSFIFIDDDVEVLKERLQALRMEQAPVPFLQSMKRPPLASLHRPRSTNHVPFASSHTPITNRAQVPVVILHFTSLSNYKHLKETVQSIVATFVGTSIPVPEVMIIPKPAGPRRFLAALYTAVTKPTVDPQFSPIATSPMSPSVSSGSPFFGPLQPSSSSTEAVTRPPSRPISPTKLVRPTGSRSNSNQSIKATRDVSDSVAPAIPPSPLAIPDNIEYFSAAAQKLGSTPSSGLVIQSPDGQPAGILFRPNLKPRSSRMTSRILSTPSMERDNQGRKTPPLMPSRRVSNARAAPSGMLDFRALHAANGSSMSPSGLGGSTSVPPVVSSTAPPTVSTSTVPLPPSTPGAERPANVSAGSSPSVLPASVAPTATTRKSSLGPKPTSPPGSPKTDTATPRRATTRKSSQVDKESSSTPTPMSTAKKGKLPENNIIPPISVLIVDDNPINQTILSTFMRKKKIKYDIANNGAEAVQKWRTGGFHLILMDIQMPIMDGIEATKEIRRLEKTNSTSGFPQLTPTTEGQRTPSDVSSDSRSAASPYRSSVIIVALTASSLQSDRVAALAAGCNDFLTKPVSLLWLNNKIIEWGSIKALQMWADLRPDIVRSMNTGQAVQARAVADNLYVPKRRKTPSPKRNSSLKEEQDAAIALASPSGGGQIPPAVQKAMEMHSMQPPPGGVLRPSSRLPVAMTQPISSRRASVSPDAIAETRSAPTRGASSGSADYLYSCGSVSPQASLPPSEGVTPSSAIRVSATLLAASTSQETIIPEKVEEAPTAPQPPEAPAAPEPPRNGIGNVENQQ